MKVKIYRHSILLVALFILLVSSCVIVGGCEYNTEVAEPKFGPLESPFNEIIPSAEDIVFIPYYSSNENTLYSPDGLITYLRIYGNESASYIPLSGDKKPESPAVVLSMCIYEYQDDEQATKRIQEEKTRKWYDKSDSEFYTKYLGFPPDDIVGSVHFWKEPGDKEVQGEEVIIFRVGRYVGDYKIHMNDPPKLDDGYFMPPYMHDYLEFAVMKTNIPKIRSLQNT